VPLLFPPLAYNIHLAQLKSHYGNIAVSRAQFPAALRVLCLCYTNRCGSTFLAEAVHSTGRLNMAVELLNADSILEDAATSLGDYLAAQSAWRSQDGILVLKLALPHLDILAQAGILGHSADRLHFVFTTRQDRLDQAISYEIARQTGQWTSLIEIERPLTELHFCHATLQGIMTAIDAENQHFRGFFAANSLQPVELLYEDLVADPDHAVQRIGASIGMPDLCYTPAKTRLQRQAGYLNARWRERFLSGDKDD
jgi:LPS sulfotransferase NodH